MGQVFFVCFVLLFQLVSHSDAGLLVSPTVNQFSPYSSL